MIPTFLGITFLCFAVTRYVPGGPVEQALLRYRNAGSGESGSGSGGGGATTGGQITEEMVEKLKIIYGFDKPFPVAYAQWLGRLVRFDLGESYSYSRPVSEMIASRFPVSLLFGLTGFLLAYTICIPLGVYKATRHGSPFDLVSSSLVFMGYAIPGWAMGITLMVLLGKGGPFLQIFPPGGIHSPEGFDALSTFGRAADVAWHMVLPVLCYTLGSFATLTVLMKNSLMENLGQDYVRTAFAKGLDERKVIFKHALRNSLIPIATGLGHQISLVIAGSYLIEYTFDIHGFGHLGFRAIQERDYPIVLGILVISSSLKLIGNILSDLMYCFIDPRIRFQ